MSGTLLLVLGLAAAELVIGVTLALYRRGWKRKPQSQYLDGVRTWSNLSLDARARAYSQNLRRARRPARNEARNRLLE